ncbi:MULTISPECIES: UDP-2,3-diacylglucosamine diphosphatase [unclassified Thiomonas]|uniref:UDP-2,3-diacylglucosamine diphosphatase n=1 Tax=unclassified Thiomonas TaxID=2625466 RepID=UPI0004DB9FEB|nr:MULTISPECIES: UDP-2,3-diacylglucosamine diphosphatase [unclassified Thiomonas]CDW92656.1 UDP-2,3-diacylglucosamine pyrophosphatase [Thiomonas sp. CB2]VDY05637.1 UDP-2,3-diacylglucosamine pyrophosphatase [Thiomonas sp. Bio17B3]VDY07196.1 UDP-2,3-diacylglucosamine pyrophosphatase [Thiomonas sp. Sup16B3]VDY13892.1 putative UDP-2,3-diacylglucosamine hydrolase LpxH [Thiomonas sp. OC7]VDY16907.1 UDP-2,3-diacylglucosamine pyrophosphatase [Thiomonas sp. CB2]
MSANTSSAEDAAHAPRPEPAFPSLIALPAWRRIALVSDLHLGAQAPRTAQTFIAWLADAARAADALFILGDLFEAWIGDDLLDPAALAVAPEDAACAQDIVGALRAYTDSGCALFVQHGNRDFLLGQRFQQATGAQILPDPVVLTFQAGRTLLTHGDQLCTADTAYQQFRATVRNAEWQRQVLAQPLAARVQQARAMRAASNAAQARPENWADADPAEARRWLARAACTWMIHGHTHRPRNHWQGGQLRQVLSDWDCDAAHSAQPRTQALWLCAQGQGLEVSIQRCD